MKTLTSIAFITAAASLVQGSTIDINGGASWNGWSNRGGSQDVGVYSTGSRTSDFTIYTTSFKYNSAVHIASGSTFGNADLSTFAQDAIIFGIGVKVNNGSNLTTQNATVKFNLNNLAPFQAESAFGANDGIQASRWLQGGSFQQQHNGVQNSVQSGMASFFSRFDDFDTGNGANFSEVNAPNSSFANSFYNNDGSSFQLFFDFNAYRDIFGTATPNGLFNLILNIDGTSVFVNNLAVVPLPTAAWAGLAMLGGIVGVRKIRRR